MFRENLVKFMTKKLKERERSTKVIGNAMEFKQTALSKKAEEVDNNGKGHVAKVPDADERVVHG